MSSYGLNLSTLDTLKLRHRDETGLRSDYGHETIDALPLLGAIPCLCMAGHKSVAALPEKPYKAQPCCLKESACERLLTPLGRE